MRFGIWPLHGGSFADIKSWSMRLREGLRLVFIVKSESLAKICLVLSPYREKNLLCLFRIVPQHAVQIPDWRGAPHKLKREWRRILHLSHQNSEHFDQRLFARPFFA